MSEMNLTRDARKLWDIASELREYTRREFGQEFTKPLSNLGENGVFDIANFLADRVFANEFEALEKAKSAMGEDSVKAVFKEEFLNHLKENLVTSQENSIFKYSQNTGQYVSNLSTIDQLHMVALIAGVIQSTYSIIFKTHVEKGLTFTREVDLPYVITSDGEMIDFFDLVNNGKKLLEVAGTNSPTSTVEFTVTGGKVTGNIIDEYNKELLAKDPTTNRITGPYDFLNRGLEIVEITENGKKIPVKWVGTGYPTQSGQRSDVVTTFSATLTDKEEKATKTVRVLGDVKLNGDIVLFVDGGTVTKIKVKFNLPAIGPRRPIQFNTRKTPIVVQIGESFSAQTTLNQNFLEKNTLVLKANLIEDFHKFSMTAVNRHKDEYAFQFIDDTIAKLEGIAANANPLENFETTLTKNRTFAKETVEAYNANKGYVSTLEGNEDVLSRAMFKVTNKLEQALNPQERKYTIYGSTASAQWVREADGGHFNKFQELGDLGEGSLAGLSLPYQLRKIRIGGHATGYFISTNARKSTVETSVSFTPAGHTTPKTADIDVHRYVVNTNYEAHLDTYAFLQGPEYIEQGTGTDQFGKNTSLQLETMFEMTAFNESIGVIDFKEDPLNFN
jgi:hypothetical protein|nr:MAG TPA: hypothetical protein [Caudoviricetes sp.]